MWLRNAELVSWLSSDVVSSRYFSYQGDFSDANCFIINLILFFPGLPGHLEKVNNINL